MTWRSVYGEDRNNIREVIPKLHYIPDFLTYSNMFVLGEWWSEWGYLTDRLPSTAVWLNTCVHWMSHTWPNFVIFTHSYSIQKLENM